MYSILFQEYMTAFNFANEDEAKLLRNVLIEKIEQRKQRREGKFIDYSPKLKARILTVE